MDQFWWQDTQLVWANGVMCWQSDCPEDCQPGTPDEPAEFECFCCEDGDTDRTPEFWTVEIPNGTNNGCTDCGTMAGTYELHQVSEAQSCDYELDGTGADCSLDYLILNVICGESNQLQCQIAQSSGFAADGGWLYEDFEASFSCAQSYELDEDSFLGTGNQCDWTGTTVTATPSLS